MRGQIQQSQGLSRLCLGWVLTMAAVTLAGCEPAWTTGRLGLVTKNNVDSAMLLKSGQRYRELGLTSASECNDTAKDVLPHDNFAKVVEQALNSKDADALMDVTTTTHRGTYFPRGFFLPIPLFPIAVPVSERLCTSVLGTAIKFIESPNCAPCVVGQKALRTWHKPEDSSEDSDEVPMIRSLRPTLKWDPFPGLDEDVTYDLTIWTAKVGLHQVQRGSIVYERQGLTEPSHRIETALELSTHYLWAVRAHFKHDGETQVTPWSYEIAARAPDKPQYYHFWTPAL